MLKSCWADCWRDLVVRSPSDVWFDRPRWPDSKIAMGILNFGRIFSFCLYSLNVYWCFFLPMPKSGFWVPGRELEDLFLKLCELTNWSSFCGFCLFGWLIQRKFHFQEETWKLAETESRGRRSSFAEGESTLLQV